MDIKLSTKTNLVEQVIPLSMINGDLNINPRKELDSENIAALVKVEVVPPIILGYCIDVDPTKLTVIDGYHRYETRKIRKDETISVFIFKYDNLDEMKKDAFIRNATHGKKLSDIEIAYAIDHLRKYYEASNLSFSFESLGKETGLGARKIRNLLAWIEVSTIINDPSIPMSAADALYKYIVAGTPDKLIDFWSQYSTLPVKDIREAIKMFDEGKNFFHEKLNNLTDDISKIDETIANPLTEEEKEMADLVASTSESLSALSKTNDKTNSLLKISIHTEVKTIKSLVSQKVTALKSIMENNKKLTNPIKIDPYAKYISDIEDIVSMLDELKNLAEDLWDAENATVEEKM